jgi:hypothetical protein
MPFDREIIFEDPWQAQECDACAAVVGSGRDG